MSVCPKCGWRDNPCWRNSRWELYTQYCRLEELVDWEPDIVEKLKENYKIEEGPYFYHLRGKGFVHRTPKELRSMYERGHSTEKPKDPFQKKLLECIEK